ncbi:MAG: hypothetical protein ACREUL_20030 [Steroidobacteraceae bacterium]
MASSALGAENIQIHSVQIPNELDYWRNAGFVDMVGPAQLPTDKATGDHIAVWLRIPRGKKITVQWLPDQKRYTVKFPPRTVADRVESAKNEHDAMLVIHGISDVRGARIGADGEIWFHDYEPIPGEPIKWLKGYEWLRTDPAGDSLAADSLIKLFYPGAPTKADTEMAEFRRLNQCGACHQRNRPVPVTASKDGLSFPETDADGFYQPITVLTDTMTLVNIRPWDLNAGDPYITVWCGRKKAQLTTQDHSYRRYTCSDNGVPTGRLDILAAFRHRDSHALKVCAARRYLYQHMAKDARKAFARGFAECSIH